jgi:hypothetical protein
MTGPKQKVMGKSSKAIILLRAVIQVHRLQYGY